MPPRSRLLWTAVTAVTLAVGGGALPAGGVDSPSAVTERSVRLAPVRAGDVDPELNPGILAARARAEREAIAYEGATGGSDTPTGSATETGGPTTGGDDATSAPEPVDAPPSDVREHASQVLASLPGGDAIEIAWNHPDIGNHLGGVRLDDPTVMMLNAHRFETQPERVEATVKHEIAHYYQGAVIAENADGDWWSGYWKLDAALQPVFGSKWMERSADCVALHLGADWTHYTSDCSGKAKRNAVEALVAGEMPA